MTNVLVGLIAGLHVYFLILEMFLWTKPVGRRVFGSTVESARASATLAANQGLYNGFLVAGLVWSLWHADPTFAFQLKSFFLSCVAVAGIYGGFTVSRRIFFVQAVPALVALTLLVLVG